MSLVRCTSAINIRLCDMMCPLIAIPVQVYLDHLCGRINKCFSAITLYLWFAVQCNTVLPTLSFNSCLFVKPALHLTYSQNNLFLDQTEICTLLFPNIGML